MNWVTNIWKLRSCVLFYVKLRELHQWQRGTGNKLETGDEVRIVRLLSSLKYESKLVFQNSPMIEEDWE